MNLPTVEQLETAVSLRRQIDTLEARLGGIFSTAPTHKRKMSAAARAKISKAQRKRWAAAR